MCVILQIENIELESRPTFKDELKAERMSDQFSNTKVHLDPSVKSESLFSGMCVKGQSMIMQ